MPPRLNLFRLSLLLLDSIPRTARWMPRENVVDGRKMFSQNHEALFSYRLGVAAAAKTTRVNQPLHGQNFWTQQLLKSVPSYLSSVQKHSGEDAFFMSHVAGSNRHVIFGLADGVGGWQDQGINPAKFSHGLCRYMAEATYRPEKEHDLRPCGLCRYMAEATYRPEKEHDLRPKNLLQKAYDLVIGDRSIVAGGSTAALATLEPTGTMEAANLGDSGFVILQPGKVAHKSEPQTHAFNTPYQLSKLTPRMLAQRSIFGGSAQISEAPNAAEVSSHSLRHGDVVLFASDGVWDNLSAMEILDTVSKVMEKQGYWTKRSGTSTDATTQEASVNATGLRALSPTLNTPEDDLLGNVAFAVMRQAKAASLDTRRDGPFAKEVHKNYPAENWHGGKVDDICVVVALAIQDGNGDSIPKAKL